MADEPLKIVTEPLSLIPVTVIGGTGNGTVKDKTVAITPPDQPNLVTRVIPPFMAISSRFGNAYLTTLVGFLTVGMTTTALPASDFYHLVLKCSALSLAGPVVSLLKDLITIFANLEKKYPLLTGSV